jgi:Na+/proline symporter/nitrogen-specific signal transduction histidine kinase
MLKTETILLVSFGYIGLLFAIAYWGDKRADQGRSVISNPYIYALSLAVYCTAWTFYGSVGLAARSGLDFLTVYIGPTLMSILGWLVLRKIIRISKINRITSIADFIASRYGKSTFLGGIVAFIAVVGIIPYISLQLKAISTSFLLVTQYPQISADLTFANIPVFQDTAFYVTLILAVFSILFGTRHLDAAERHEGVVAAIAFESIVKLAAFITVGLFVTYAIHHGFSDLFGKAAQLAGLKQSFTMGAPPLPATPVDKYLSTSASSSVFGDWSLLIFLSMMAIICLPRQFQVAVVENVNEEHLNRALWLFPLYLLAINLFVLPVAFSGALHFPDGSVNADDYVLALPMAEQHPIITLIVYLGGMSAATGMVIVETIALSTMICNNIVMPVLLHQPLAVLSERQDYTGMLLAIRRTSIVLVLLLGYIYFHNIGEFYSLVSIGMISFAAITQFAPAILGGLFWKGGTRAGAVAGLLAGFAVWAYTLFLPSLSMAGIVSQDFVTQGPFGISLLKPYELFGLTHFSTIPHAIFWCLLANVSAYIIGSIYSRPRAIDHAQAALFVDVFKYSGETGDSQFWRGTANLPDLRSLLQQFLGQKRADAALASYASRHGLNWDYALTADAGLVSHAERLLAGAIGSTSARVMVSSVVKEEPLGIDELLDILDEARQVLAYSRELERTTSELQTANLRLKELDRLKDEFISTVTHELRTPLTSIRSLAEILHNNPDLAEVQHRNFSDIIIKESERLTRLINQVLDYEKIESAHMDWAIAPVQLAEVIQDGATATRQLVNEKGIGIDLSLEDRLPPVSGDRDRLVQVIVNLISNAVKFCPARQGRIDIRLFRAGERLRVDVTDNGIGIKPEDQPKIFEKFLQIKDPARGRPIGTGMGLTICKRIIDFHHGRIWVKSLPGDGSTFSFTLPISSEAPNASAS